MELVDDPELGQVKWERGSGLITKLDRRENNAGVTIEMRGLKHPVTGWTSGDDAEANAVADEAFAAGSKVVFAIRTRRKSDVALDVPLAKLSPGDKVREVIELRHWRADADGGHDTNGAGSAPQRPQEATTAPPAAETPPTPTEASAGDSGADTANEGDPGPTEPPAGDEEQPERRGPRIAEGKAWEAFNTDGSLNVGSYAVQAAAGMVDRAWELIVEHRRRLLTDKPFTADMVKPGQVLTLAKSLLRAADEVQRRVRADGHVDRMANSHTRARGAVHTALALYPPPFGVGETPEERQAVIDAWVDDLARTGTELLVVACTIAREDLG